jgi:CBS-domain-containing membrane protein
MHDVPGEPARVPVTDPSWPARVREAGTRYWKWVAADLAMAVPPTAIVLVAFFGTQLLTSHPILFASLASSAFLIYRLPHHYMNRVRVMVAAQTVGWLFGLGSSAVFGSGYTAAALAMIGTIVVLISFRIVHPPAVSTALGFSLFGPNASTVESFLVALTIVASLAILQRVVTWVFLRVHDYLGPWWQMGDEESD